MRAPATARQVWSLAALGAGVLLLALALLGARYHWVEEAGSAERDGFVAQAEQLRAGSLPRDPYRPLLYPLLTAAITPLAGSEFAAARLLSNLAAAALALAAFALGRRLGGTEAGIAAFALTAVNPNLWILGQHVSTDVFFAALVAWCLVAGLEYLLRPGWGAALAAAALAALAGFTRGNAIFLLPALLMAWVLAPTASRHEPGPEPAFKSLRWGHLAAAVGVALLVLLPHWGLRQAVFGDPFYSENWKNVAWKLYGYPDWSYLDRVPFSGLGDVVRHDPKALLAGWGSELWRLATGGFSQLLGTELHALVALAGIFALFLLPRAEHRGLAQARWGAAWLLFAALSFTAAVALVFFTWGRLLLFLLPVTWAMAAAGAVRGSAGPWQRSWQRRWAGRILVAAMAGLVGLLALKTFAFRLPAFVDRHPYTEVAVLRRLAGSKGQPAVLAGTSPFLGRYVPSRYVALPDAFGAEVDHPEQYLARLRALLEDEGVDFLVVGAVDLRSRPAALVGEEPPVPWLEFAGGEESPSGPVVTWRVLFDGDGT